MLWRIDDLVAEKVREKMSQKLLSNGLSPGRYRSRHKTPNTSNWDGLRGQAALNGVTPREGRSPIFPHSFITQHPLSEYMRLQVGDFL